MAARAFLESLDGETDGVELLQGKVVVGRNSLCNVVVANESRYSREHFCIEPAIGDTMGEFFTVRDLESRHGTLLNGKKLQPQRTYPLQPGDIVGASGSSGVPSPAFQFVVLNSPDEFKENALQRYSRKRKRQPEHPEQLTERLWQERKFSDVRVVCDDQEIHAHRAVLAAASPVFESMLSSGMQEDRERTIRLSDPASAVEAMLEYIYTGHLTDSCDAAAVLLLADRFELSSLAEECAAALLRSMTPESAVKTIRAVKKFRERPRIAPLWSGMRNTFRALLMEDAVLDDCIDSL